MTTKEQELREILAVVNAISPLVTAYKNDELTPEECVFLEQVIQSVWPTFQAYLAVIWEKLEPILIAHGHWPINEITEEDLESRRLSGCVEKWPACYSGGYNPACCRFPKSCSPHGRIEAVRAGNLTEDDLEPEV